VPQPTPPPETEPEPDIQHAFERIVSEGADRRARPWLPLVQTGLLGGIDVGTGVFAYLVVMAKTHDTLLAGLAFSVGFVALLLARSELFTENFLVPVTAVVARKGTPGALARLWGTTLALNLVGGWVITWLIIEARPTSRPLPSKPRPTTPSWASTGTRSRSRYWPDWSSRS